MFFLAYMKSIYLPWHKHFQQDDLQGCHKHSFLLFPHTRKVIVFKFNKIENLNFKFTGNDIKNCLMASDINKSIFLTIASIIQNCVCIRLEYVLSKTLIETIIYSLTLKGFLQSKNCFQYLFRLLNNFPVHIFAHLSFI